MKHKLLHIINEYQRFMDECKEKGLLDGSEGAEFELDRHDKLFQTWLEDQTQEFSKVLLVDLVSLSLVKDEMIDALKEYLS